MICRTYSKQIENWHIITCQLEEKDINFKQRTHTMESTMHESSSTCVTAEHAPVPNQPPEQTALRKLLNSLHAS